MSPDTLCDDTAHEMGGGDEPDAKATVRIALIEPGDADGEPGSETFHCAEHGDEMAALLEDESATFTVEALDETATFRARLVMSGLNEPGGHVVRFEMGHYGLDLLIDDSEALTLKREERLALAAFMAKHASGGA